MSLLRLSWSPILLIHLVTQRMDVQLLRQCASLSWGCALVSVCPVVVDDEKMRFGPSDRFTDGRLFLYARLAAAAASEVVYM